MIGGLAAIPRRTKRDGQVPPILVGRAYRTGCIRNVSLILVGRAVRADSVLRTRSGRGSWGKRVRYARRARIEASRTTAGRRRDGVAAPYTRPVTRPVPPAGRGRFITIEGPEGAGKTVQAARLEASLTDRGVQVRGTREPGGTALGERIRALLLDPATTPVDPLADALLFNAARRQLVEEVVEPALAAGTTVICARYADSTRAYQGYGGGMDLDVLADARGDRDRRPAAGPDAPARPPRRGRHRPQAARRPDPVRDRVRSRVPPSRPQRLPRDGGPRARPVPGVRRHGVRGRGRRADPAGGRPPVLRRAVERRVNQTDRSCEPTR